MLKNKKGMSQAAVLTLILIGVLGFMIYNGNFTANVGQSVAADSSWGNCKPKYDISLSGITSGVTKIDKGGNNFDLIMTSTDLNSANTTAIDFTITADRVDACHSEDGGELSDKLEYYTTSYDFKNVVTPSDSTVYYTVYYSASTGQGYNTTVDSVDWASNGMHRAQDTTTWSTAGSAAVKVDVEDFTTLDKGIADDYDTLDVANIKVGDGTISLKYMKD